MASTFYMVLICIIRLKKNKFFIFRVWYKLYCRVKPLLEDGKEQEQLEELVNKINEKEEILEKEKKICEMLEEEIKKLNQETEELKKELEGFNLKKQASVDCLNAINAKNVLVIKIQLI